MEVQSSKDTVYKENSLLNIYVTNYSYHTVIARKIAKP